MTKVNEVKGILKEKMAPLLDKIPKAKSAEAKSE